MYTYAQIDGELDRNFNARMLRAALGVGIAGTFLTGIWVTPAWVFAASVMAIYLVTTAILDKTIPNAIIKSLGQESRRSAYESNVGYAGRMVRGATAGAALGGVLGDALIDTYLLDAFGIFALNFAGVYLAMTAIIAWDPVNALFRSGPYPAMPATPSVARTLPGTGQVTEPQPVTAKDVA